MTHFHASYLAHELTRRCASDSVDKLAPVLADTRVDLNSQPFEAALAAFRSPFSKGAILAVEAGLIRAIAERKSERVMCLDVGFAGNEQLTDNAEPIFKTQGVTSFKTV